MYTLSEEQVDYILRDIKSRGVEMEDLQVSLLDHICCVIECELEPGGDFESFYRKTIPRFYKKELWEIEEETTLLLTFKNYYAMRKTMIITGVISVVLFIAGSFLKFMHWGGANLTLFTAIVTVSFVFLPLFFIFKTREANATRDKIILVVGTVFGMFISVATLFKVMHWTGANIMWLAALGILFLVFVPVFFFSGIRNPETKINTITSSIFMVVAGGLLFTLTNLGPNMMNAFGFPDNLIITMHENLVRNNIALYEKAAYDSIAMKKALKVKELSRNMSAYISQLKELLLTTIDPDLKGIPQTEIMFNQSNYKDNWDVPTGILIGNDSGHPRQDAYSAIELKNKIAGYRAGLLDLLDDGAKADVNNYIGLKTDDIVGSRSTQRWEIWYFYHNPIAAVITQLDQFQNEVSYAEHVALTKLVK